MDRYRIKNVVEALERTFGGSWKWNAHSKKWVGESFSVYKLENRLRRSDTGQTLAFEDGVFRQSKYILVRDSLKEKFGGTWEFDKNFLRWRSKKHKFTVYRGSIFLDRKVHQAYRRSDTDEVLDIKHNNKILELLNKKRHSMKL